MGCNQSRTVVDSKELALRNTPLLVHLSKDQCRNLAQLCVIKNLSPGAFELPPRQRTPKAVDKDTPVAES